MSVNYPTRRGIDTSADMQHRLYEMALRSGLRLPRPAQRVPARPSPPAPKTAPPPQPPKATTGVRRCDNLTDAVAALEAELDLMKRHLPIRL